MVFRNPGGSWAQFPEAEVEELSAELFGLLANIEGEYLQAVEVSQGLAGWWKLLHRSAPQITARGVRLVGLVASSPKISE